MPNATLAANAKSLSRRLFFASGSAAIVFGALHGVAANANAADVRLLALIQKGNRLWEEMGDYGKRCDSVLADQEGRRVRPEDEKKLLDIMDDYRETFEEALRIPPQSPSAFRAMLEWIKTDSYGIGMTNNHLKMMLESFLASPLLKGEA